MGVDLNIITDSESESELLDGRRSLCERRP